ncbi:anti-anti-sigma factor [Prosthecochloris sp. GSB1]|uniref:STAS domain-containing protein n=1 Tax=Prosthecochloris sp. GSB1 TaxID=281093 RepID=UPI000B8CA346|nr:STAS domain-containing protein [Prosthecochloris sp. GSB1]ASQ90309.1 anti-anti-sigma factor [Prosthecochloris sp. GSB1]
MKHSVSNRKDLTILKIDEPVFDVRHAENFRKTVHEMLQDDGQKNLIIDFSLVKAIDSCGIGCLLLAHQMANRSDGLAIFVSLCQQIKDLLKLSGLDKQLYIFTSINEVMTLVEPQGKGKKHCRRKSTPKPKATLNDESQKEIDLIASADFNRESLLDGDDGENGLNGVAEDAGSLEPCRHTPKKRGRPRKEAAETLRK